MFFKTSIFCRFIDVLKFVWEFADEKLAKLDNMLTAKGVLDGGNGADGDDAEAFTANNALNAAVDRDQAAEYRQKLLELRQFCHDRMQTYQEVVMKEGRRNLQNA